jgi:penicillin-binding protein 2
MQRIAVKDVGAEVRMFQSRAWIGLGLMVLALLLIAGRFFYLQVIEHHTFVGRSEANRVKLEPIPPTRGRILDRNGVVLADNRPSFRLEIEREIAGDLAPVLERLGQIVPLGTDELEAFNKLSSATRRFIPVPLKFDLSEDDIARFALDRHRFPGVEVVAYQTRVYPLGAELAHTVGYVGRIDADDLARDDASNYAGSSHIGKLGLEAAYERALHGKTGFHRVEVNAQGRVLRTLDTQPPTHGQDLHLSIDAELEREAIRAFGDATGALVAIDPRSGEVLCMASVPGYDPNPFVNGISQAAYSKLLNDPLKPLFNRALRGVYEPGSTIKPFIGLAGLEMGLRAPDYTVLSTGVFRLPGRPERYRDWRRSGHGRVDLTQALAQSVNTYFYQLAFDMGIDRIHPYLGQFGFGAPTQIDVGNEVSGLLPSREWKQAARKQPWFPGETVITGIGQGFFTATPVQLASATATLAAGGVRHVPRVGHALDETPITPTAPQRRLVRDPANLALVAQGMEAVVHDRNGTARALAVGSPFRIAAKTGTAQVYTRRAGESEATPAARNLRNNALIIAYAPAEAPTIAVAVIVEHGESGAKAAAPIAKQVLDFYLSRPAL